MSKASEWAGRDHERSTALDKAREEIDARMADDAPGKPAPFMRDRNVLASVTRADGLPRMVISTFSSPVWLTNQEAMNLARWILDTFSDSPPAPRGGDE